MSLTTRRNLGDWASTTNSAQAAVFHVEFVALNPPEPIKAEADIPNAVTIQAMKDIKAGKNVVRCESADDMFRKLGI